jgi:hypothetical protein
MNTPESSCSSAAPATSPSPETLGLRLLRFALSTGLALALTLLFGLAVIGWSHTAREALEPLLSSPRTATVSRTAMILTAAFILLTPTALLALLLRQRRFVWLVLGCGWAAVIPVLVWLAWDDAEVRRPMTFEELSPAFDGAERSYALLMQYSKQNPSAPAKAFATEINKLSPWKSVGPGDGDKWQAYLTAERAALEADWIFLAPQRQWWAELNAFERIGDLTPPRYDADIITFQVWRALAQRSCAIASLQALDGQGDAAIATMLPVLQLGRKLQLTSRYLVRSMIGVVLEKMAMQTAMFALDHAVVSPATLAKLDAALSGGDGPAGARHLIEIEVPITSGAIARSRLGDLWSAPQASSSALTRGLLNSIGPFLFNARATANIYNDHYHRMAALAEARELGKLEAWGNSLEADSSRQRGMKNLGGRMFVGMALPTFTKVVKSYWDTQDMRAALRTRIAAPKT